VGAMGAVSIAIRKQPTEDFLRAMNDMSQMQREICQMISLPESIQPSIMDNYGTESNQIPIGPRRQH
jgi:hypothetical protein